MSSSKGGDSHHTESACGSLFYGRSKSSDGGCAFSQYSKSYVLFSATNAASTAIDFSRKNVDNGVVDNPPSRGPWRSPVLLASPLEGSHRIEGQHCSPSLELPSSKTHYKHCMDDVPRNAFVHSHIQCSSAPGHVCIHSIHPRCTTVDHLRVKDNHFASSPPLDVSFISITKMKDVGGGGEHPRLEDTVQVHNLVLPKFECSIGPGILCPGHSYEPVCL